MPLILQALKCKHSLQCYHSQHWRMLGATSLAETVCLLEKPAYLVGAEPERLTLTVASSISLQRPGHSGTTGRRQRALFHTSLWVLVHLLVGGI